MDKQDTDSSLEPNAPKRRSYSASFKRQLVEQSLAPGASVAKLALRHRLNANLLFKWRRQHLRECHAGGKSVAVLPVSIDEAPELVGSSSTESASSGSARGAPSGSIEIELSKGRVRLEGAVDLEALRTLVRVLSD